MDDFEEKETAQQTNNVISPFVRIIRFAGLLMVTSHIDRSNEDFKITPIDRNGNLPI